MPPFSFVRLLKYYILQFSQFPDMRSATIIFISFCLFSSVVSVRAASISSITPTASGIVELFGTYGALAPQNVSTPSGTTASAQLFQNILGALHNMFNGPLFSSEAPQKASSSTVSSSSVMNFRDLSIGNPDFGEELAELFVLGKLFAGHSSGILSENGTDLGDIFILYQLFR